MERDPDQFHNLAGDPAQADTVRTLRAKLTEESGGPGETPRRSGEAPTPGVGRSGEAELSGG
jgi:hypothetical protein